MIVQVALGRWISVPPGVNGQLDQHICIVVLKLTIHADSVTYPIIVAVGRCRVAGSPHLGHVGASVLERGMDPTFQVDPGIGDGVFVG